MGWPFAGHESYRTARIGCWPAVVAILLTSLPGAACDVLYLVNGGSIEGEIVESDGEHYKVRTVVGAITVAASSVERVEKSPSPFAEYEQRRSEARDSAAEHTALAEWCGDTGLKAERLRHLRRAVELDADCGPARRALGYVRVGSFWVDGRTVLRRQAPGARPSGDGAEAGAELLDDEEKLLIAMRLSWRRRVRAIRISLLESPLERSVRRGREEILAITDPLAIGPLAQELSRGGPVCRAVLVEALSAFNEDEASMNLAILALVEPEREFREAALSEIVRRNDPRTIPQYRQALQSRNEAMLLRAAVGLGRLRATEAVPDLINVLTRRRMKKFLLRPDTILQGVRAAYGAPHSTRLGYVGRIGVGPVAPSTVTKEVTVYRTEVREALRRITGQDFGFDRSAWRQWYEREYKP